MDEVEIVAVLNMANGNESVGTEWLETKVFPHNIDLLTVMKWAHSIIQKGKYPENLNVSDFRGNLRLTIKQ